MEKDSESVTRKPLRYAPNPNQLYCCCYCNGNLRLRDADAVVDSWQNVIHYSCWLKLDRAVAEEEVR